MQPLPGAFQGRRDVRWRYFSRIQFGIDSRDFRIDIESAATPLDATNGFRDGKQSWRREAAVRKPNREMMLQDHVEVMSFNLDSRGVLQDSLDRLADLMTRLVAIAPNVPEAKILLQKNAAKQASFAGFVVKMRP